MRIGDKITRTITDIKPYGAFVALDNGATGFIRIPEIKTGYIGNIYQLLSVGKRVLVQVVDFNELTQKASLSPRALGEEEYHLHRRHRFSNSHLNTDSQPLADNLPKWTKESLELLTKE